MAVIDTPIVQIDGVTVTALSLDTATGLPTGLRIDCTKDVSVRYRVVYRGQVFAGTITLVIGTVTVNLPQITEARLPSIQVG